jgi:hypothetical protein
MKQHRNLSLRKPQATSLSRGTSFNKHNVAVFFSKLTEVMDRYCDERGIYTFYFITIAEIIHLKFNKFKFVQTTSKLFLCNLGIPFLNTHTSYKCQNVEKNRAVPTKGFLEFKTVANRKINFFSFKRPCGISLSNQGGETPTILDQSTKQSIHLHTKR